MPGQADALREMAAITSVLGQMPGTRPPAFWVEVARIVCERHGVKSLRGHEDHPPEDLSHRRREVLALYAEGLTHSQVAHRLGLAENTIKGHLWHARHELHAHSTCHAVALAMRAGLID